MGEQFNDLMIDWSCVKILKHLCKIIFSEGFRALWAKLDTSQKNMYCDYLTFPAKLHQP